MANTTIITASNGYKYRPMKESDYTFFMECWKDFPQGIQTYDVRTKRFSDFLQCNEGYGTEALIKSGDVNNTDKCVTWTHILEKADGTAVGVGVNVFAFNNEIFAKFGIIHPDHRGNKHWTAMEFMNLGLGERVEVTYGYSWFYETNPVNGSFGGAARTKYDAAGIDISQTGKTVVTPVENSADGVQFSTEEVNLQKNYSTIAQYRTYKSNNSDWASVSYSYSST